MFYKLQWLLRLLQWKLGGDQKYSLSGDSNVHGKILDE